MKSEHILTSNFFKKNTGFYIYIFFLVLLIISWFLKPTKIETDIFSFFPKTEKNILKESIYNIVLKKVSNKIIVLLSDNSQENSYNAAVSFYEQIKEKKFVKETQFYISKTTNEDFLSFYFPHKYHILSPETYNFLKEKKAKLLIEKTQRTIHSPFSILGLSKIKEDPFLLSNAYLSSLSISDISLIPYKDILMSNFKERYYAFLSFVIPAEQASSPKELFSLMEKLKQIKKQTETQFKNSEVIITGIPVHTHDATKQSIKNINQIGIISIIGIFLLVYLVFNAFKPFFFSILSIGIGFIVAVCTTGFIFDKIHLLTLVFGTSLIGISIDYAFHFFSAHWQKNKPEHIKSNIALSRIFPGITLGLITSILGFGALIFPSFPILKQISIFTISGLIGAYLSVVLIFPKFYNPSLCKKKDFYLSVLKIFLMLFHKKVFVRAVLIIFLLMLVIGVSGIFFIKPSNNLQNFYTVSKKNFKNDQKVNTILQYQNSTQFFFILGKTSQEVLEKEELLLLQLNKLISNNTLGSYRATSQLIPSFKKQKENLSLIENNLMLPYLSQQALFLGFSEQETKVIEDDFNKIKQTYITIKPILYLKDLWLGKINQGYGSVVLLSSIKKTNPLRKLENEKKIELNFDIGVLY